MAPDKIAHLKAGAGVAAIAGFSSFALPALLHPVAIAVGLAGLAAAFAVEYAQHDTNRRMKAMGLAPIHDVSVDDALASAVPPLVVAAAAQLAHLQGWM